MRFGCFGCAIFCFASMAMAAQPNALTLKALVTLAERNHLTLTENRLNQDKSDEQVRLARSTLLPSLAIETSGEWTTPASSRWTSHADIILKQSLYDGGVSWSKFSESRLARDRLNLSSKNSREEVTLEILKAFVFCGQKESRVRAAHRKLELLEAQIDLVQRQFQQGLKQRRNFQLLEAEMERARILIDRSENEQFESYRDLETLVGSPETKIDSTNLIMLTGDRILSLAQWKLEKFDFQIEKESLEWRAQSLNVQEQELALNRAKRQYWPTLSANATAAYGAPNWIGSGSTDWSSRLDWQTSVGVSLNWTLWNWGGTSATVAQAKANQLIETQRLNQKKLELQNEYRKLRHKIERSARMLNIQKHIRDLERKNVLDTQKEYREGRMGYLDLIAGIEREIESEINQENETFEYFLAVAEFMKLKGTLYESVQTL